MRDTVPVVEISSEEIAEKDKFRAVIEKACRESITEFEQHELGNEKFDPSTVQLKCFGSLNSGFAIKASDMDVALLTPHSYPAPESSESHIPRLLEKKLLEMGFGARLLSRTRVPIIKLCQKPTKKLMEDLLQERAKWENGILMEDDEGDDDEINEQIATANAMSPKKVSSSKETQGDRLSLGSNAPQQPLEEKIATLKQKENQLLSDYFASAKRVLRKLGGRDYSQGSIPKEDEINILNTVCKAVISGLSDKLLVRQLCSYQTIAPLFDHSISPISRSLLGTFYQIEGERLCMAWDNRPVSEPTDSQELECLGLIEDWRSLQNIDYPQDPYLFNRRLYLALEQLKKIASLKLSSLEQGPHEDPLQYRSRTMKIVDSLQGRIEDRTEEFMHKVTAQYILGIRNRQIRERLLEAKESLSLEDASLYHRLLQLAIDYEHALKTGTYVDVDRPYIEQYIALLRRLSPQGLTSTSDRTDPSVSDVLKKVRNLPEPPQSNQERSRYKDYLEFPKNEVGIQCDINFSAHLALHNTQLLRCYSCSDPRVKELVLFVKAWASARGINTPYRGTLGSYGYVLMVLHYLVNIAQPFVCPNLQLQRRNPPAYLPPKEVQSQMICNGRDVQFWRNETELKSLADRKLLNHNHDSAGMLLRGFFEYFAQNGPLSTVHNRGFDWGREVLSLRTPGGILTKVEKGWVGARTVVERPSHGPPATPPRQTSLPSKDNADLHTEGGAGDAASPTQKAENGSIKSPSKQKANEDVKEIRHRYLFAIEDPFEHDHNVARTVTHQGIVAIRDEFRRAWRLLKSVGKGETQVEGLLDPIASDAKPDSGFSDLLDFVEGLVSRS